MATKSTNQTAPVTREEHERFYSRVLGLMHKLASALEKKGFIPAELNALAEDDEAVEQLLTLWRGSFFITLHQGKLEKESGLKCYLFEWFKLLSGTRHADAFIYEMYKDHPEWLPRNFQGKCVYFAASEYEMSGLEWVNCIDWTENKPKFISLCPQRVVRSNDYLAVQKVRR